MLPMTMAAAARGMTCMVVPEPQAEEAALVPGHGGASGRARCAQVVAHLRGERDPGRRRRSSRWSSASLLSWRGDQRIDDLDLADVLGMADARFALEVAAAGGHHLMLSGPKGAGKTTLAERIPGLLPDLTAGGVAGADRDLLAGRAACRPGRRCSPGRRSGRRTTRRPGPACSAAAAAGSGPGEVSRAHTGTLFLDEFPLFNADIIEALRQPLESGEVTIARGEEAATFPARTMVVIACNPCPCGDYHPSNRDNRCTCTELRRREYRKKLSGPVVDRIDIVRHVEPVRAARGPRPAGPPRADAAGPGAGERRARGGRPQRYAGTRLAAQRRRARPGAAQRVAARRRGRRRLLEDQVYAGG